MEKDSGGTRIRVPKTSELVANQIRAQIIRGELTEGDSLPPEGSLMVTLGISRPTLREAFRILEAEKLISVVRGSRSGARVHRPSTELVSRYAGYVLESQGTTVADLYSARQAIEPTVVGWLAAAGAPQAGLIRLRSVVETLGEMLAAENYDAAAEQVENFHRALVEAAENKMLDLMNNMLLNLVRQHEVDYFRRQPQPATVQDWRKSVRVAHKSYWKLLKLIDAGDIDGAVAHWRLHLQNADEIWVRRGERDRVVDSIGR